MVSPCLVFRERKRFCDHVIKFGYCFKTSWFNILAMEISWSRFNNDFIIFRLSFYHYTLKFT